MKKILFILNSDFGIVNTIGARTLHVANQFKIKNNLTIICRNYNKEEINNYNLIKIFPKAEIFMKIFTGLQVYISNKLPTNQLKNYTFDLFLLSKLKNINLNEYSTVHSWDFLPKSFKYIKSKNPNIKIIQDVPMAFANSEGEFTKKEENYNYILNSLRYIDLFIAPSPFVKKSLNNIGIKSNKISIIPFGVDVSKFKPLKIKSNRLKLAFCGNINKRKGVVDLIQAYKELNLKNIELNLYGRIYPEIKPYLKDFEKYNIKLHGFVDVSKELNKNHIFVFPSRLEGSAKAIYEAMASGLVVITTENAGSVIKNNKEGFIIPVNDISAIKEKILFLHDNPLQLEKLAKNSRKLALKYTWQKYGKEVIKLYK